MTDPLSLVGGIGACIGIFDFGIRACNNIIEYYRALKGHDKEIGNAVDSAEQLLLCLTILEPRIRDTDGEEDRSALLARKCIISCEKGIADLGDFFNRLEKHAPLRGKRGALLRSVDKAKFPFRRDSLHYLQGLLDRLQRNLQTSLLALLM